MEFTTRYGKGAGPDPKTMCEGQCEGLGRYPQQNGDPDATAYEREQWLKEHEDSKWDKENGCDGWHFIICEECKGTGKIKGVS